MSILGLDRSPRPRYSFSSLAIALSFSVAPGASAVVGPTEPDLEEERVVVPETPSPIRVDGRLSEDAWSEALEMSVAFEFLPGENVTPPVPTKALLLHDEENLYVGWQAQDPEPGAIRAQLMDRDSIDSFQQNDYVGIAIDTFNDERRAYLFQVNALGVQADALISEVDASQDWSFDLIWESAGAITSQGFVVEMAIPFKQLRFPDESGEKTWRIELRRSWPRSVRHQMVDHPVDRNQSCGICQYTEVSGFTGIEHGRNLEIVPTLTAVRTDRSSAPGGGSLRTGDEELDPGVTGRWSPTPNLSVQGTVNPDFSQVEADAAQLEVNERFALFFPEKRPFFQEGADFFTTPLSAVFTRTVVDPAWGLKLAGKQGPHAAGAFVTQDEVNGLLIPGNQGSRSVLLEEEVTAGVFRYRGDLGRRSTLGVLLTGRDGDGYDNWVGGADGFFRLSPSDTVRVQYLRSETRYPREVVESAGQPDGRFDGEALVASYEHFSRNWFWDLSYRDLGRGLRLDSGFEPRVDVRSVASTVSRRIWGEDDDWYTALDFGGGYVRVEDQTGRLTDEDLEVNGGISGPWQSRFLLRLQNRTRDLGGRLLENRLRALSLLELQPSAFVKLGLESAIGETFDFANRRPGESVLLRPSVELKLGTHANVVFDHVSESLEVDEGELFDADLSQLRVDYSFTVRTLLRAIVQYERIRRDPGLYGFEVEPSTETLRTQLLFSYELNPQTVVFLGYSDHRLGTGEVDLTTQERTFFLKTGYAWLP